MSHSALEYLRHILEEANYLIAKAQGLHQAQFHQDETLRRAFVRSLEIIGEAAKRVPTELRSGIHRWSGVRWQACETGSFTTILEWITTLSGMS